MAEPSPRKTKALCIATRCTTPEQFIESFYRFCDGSTFFVATLNMRTVGLETQFSIQLADRTPVLRGLCVVRDAWTSPANPYQRPGIRLEIRRLTPDSEEVFARLQRHRASVETSASEPGEGLSETPVPMPLPTLPPPRKGATIVPPIPSPPSAPPPVPRASTASIAPTMTITVHAKPAPVAEPERTPGSELILPANPLMNLTDESLEGFVDCTLFEETGSYFRTEADDAPEAPIVGPPAPDLAPVPAIARTVAAPLPAPTAAGPASAPQPEPEPEPEPAGPGAPPPEVEAMPPPAAPASPVAPAPPTSPFGSTRPGTLTTPFTPTTSVAPALPIAPPPATASASADPLPSFAAEPLMAMPAASSWRSIRGRLTRPRVLVVAAASVVVIIVIVLATRGDDRASVGEIAPAAARSLDAPDTRAPTARANDPSPQPAIVATPEPAPSPPDDPADPTDDPAEEIAEPADGPAEPAARPSWEKGHVDSRCRRPPPGPRSRSMASGSARRRSRSRARAPVGRSS